MHLLIRVVCANKNKKIHCAIEFHVNDVSAIISMPANFENSNSAAAAAAAAEAEAISGCT